MAVPLYSFVDGYVPTPNATLTSLRHQVWEFALDQRAFGPGKLLVAFADRAGRFHALAYTDRQDPIEDAFEACLRYLGRGADAAVAFDDEPVGEGPAPDTFGQVFERARTIAARRGIRLIDWIACDDLRLRSNRTPIERALLGDEWWNVGL